MVQHSISSSASSRRSGRHIRSDALRSLLCSCVTCNRVQACFLFLQHFLTSVSNFCRATIWDTQNDFTRRPDSSQSDRSFETTYSPEDRSFETIYSPDTELSNVETKITRVPTAVCKNDTSFSRLLPLNSLRHADIYKYYSLGSDEFNAKFLMVCDTQKSTLSDTFPRLQVLYFRILWSI